MSEYLVQWSIEVDAKSPTAAAALALGIQRDEGSIATIFSVRSSATGKVTHVDADLDGKGPHVIKVEEGADCPWVASTALNSQRAELVRALGGLIEQFPGFEDDEDVNGGDLVEAVGEIWPILKRAVAGHEAKAATPAKKKTRMGL